MEKERAVGKMLTSLKISNEIPESLKEHLEPLIPYLRIPFEQIYQAGWDEREKIKVGNKPHPVERVDKFGNVIEYFETMSLATATHGYHSLSLWRMIKKGKPNKKGEIWRYAKPKSKV
jgi:hypothetical protein